MSSWNISCSSLWTEYLAHAISSEFWSPRSLCIISKDALQVFLAKQFLQYNDITINGNIINNYIKFRITHIYSCIFRINTHSRIINIAITLHECVSFFTTKPNHSSEYFNLNNWKIIENEVRNKVNICLM